MICFEINACFIRKRFIFKRKCLFDINQSFFFSYVPILPFQLLNQKTNLLNSVCFLHFICSLTLPWKKQSTKVDLPDCQFNEVLNFTQVSQKELNFKKKEKVPFRPIIVYGRKTLGRQSRDLSLVGMNFLCQLASEKNSAGRVK